MAKEIINQVLVSFIWLAILVVPSISYCPNDQVCDCNSYSIKCMCVQREDITFMEDEDFLGKEVVIIIGCGRVELTKLCLKNLEVESVYILDLLELYIEPYAFDGSIIKNLNIQNITEFHLEPLGFGNIKNVSNLIISNVTFENLAAAAMADIGVQHVAIRNSHIGTIKSRALHMQNIESFLMENNVINTFDLNSIAIKHIKLFNFTRNVVISTSFGSISLVMAKEVEFGYCSFRQIFSSMIVMSNVEVFSFHHNHVENCTSRAFWSVQAQKQIRFSNNQILEADEDSLLPNIGPNAINLNIMVSENNSFVCNCKLEWLIINVNPSYDFIKENSICQEPTHLAGLKLSQLTLSLDKYGTCLSVEMLSTTVTLTTDMASTTVRETTTRPTTTEKQSIFQVTAKASIIQEVFSALFSNTSAPTKTTIKPTHSEINERFRSQENSANVCTCSTFLVSQLFFLFVWWLHVNACSISY